MTVVTRLIREDQLEAAARDLAHCGRCCIRAAQALRRGELERVADHLAEACEGYDRAGEIICPADCTTTTEEP